MMMPINCVSYAAGGKCTHQAAPRRLFGCANCIFSVPPVNDMRVKVDCVLRVEHKRPPPPLPQVVTQ